MSLTAYDVFLLMQKKIDGWFNHKLWYSYCHGHRCDIRNGNHRPFSRHLSWQDGLIIDVENSSMSVEREYPAELDEERIANQLKSVKFKSGYYVYSYYTCVENWDLIWFPSYLEAIEFFNSLISAKNSLLCDMLLFKVTPGGRARIKRAWESMHVSAREDYFIFVVNKKGNIVVTNEETGHKLVIKPSEKDGVYDFSDFIMYDMCKSEVSKVKKSLKLKRVQKQLIYDLEMPVLFMKLRKKVKEEDYSIK
jgi:hypothetical protein